MQVVQNPDIITSAKIIERLNDRIFKAELPNGKLIHVHFSKSDECSAKPAEEIEQVDFSLNRTVLRSRFLVSIVKSYSFQVCKA